MYYADIININITSSGAIANRSGKSRLNIVIVCSIIVTNN